MIYCQNCGHESHCGVPLMKELERDWTDVPPEKIEVCKYCRCDNCSEGE